MLYALNCFYYNIVALIGGLNTPLCGGGGGDNRERSAHMQDDVTILAYFMLY